MIRRAVLAVAAALPLCAQQAEPLFRFQSNFWVNLHHFVRAEARRRSQGEKPVVELPAAALDAYSDLAKAALMFNARLIRINNALATVSGDELPPGTVDPEIEAALKAAAPVYRAKLWDRHRGDNEEWIVAHAPLVQKHAASMIHGLAAAYRVTWPDGPILVDLAPDSGPDEAYTTGGPPGTGGHTVIAPLRLADPNKAFELVFHEASHTVDDQIMKRLDQEGKPPRDLWHVLIFYTSGELAKRELGKQNDAAYRTYAERGLYEKAGWQKMHEALQRDWQPWLDGKTGFDDAVRALVRDTSKPAN